MQMTQYKTGPAAIFIEIYIYYFFLIGALVGIVLFNSSKMQMSAVVAKT